MDAGSCSPVAAKVDPISVRAERLASSSASDAIRSTRPPPWTTTPPKRASTSESSSVSASRDGVPHEARVHGSPEGARPAHRRSGQRDAHAGGREAAPRGESAPAGRRHRDAARPRARPQHRRARPRRDRGGEVEALHEEAAVHAAPGLPAGLELAARRLLAQAQALDAVARPSRRGRRRRSRSSRGSGARAARGCRAGRSRGRGRARRGRRRSPSAHGRARCARGRYPAGPPRRGPAPAAASTRSGRPRRGPPPRRRPGSTSSAIRRSTYGCAPQRAMAARTAARDPRTSMPRNRRMSAYARRAGGEAAAGRARGRRARGHGHEPGQGLLPGGRDHQARRRPLLRRGGGGRAARRGRTAQRARPLRERHPRRVLLPEARARLPPGLDRGRGAELSLRADRGGGRARGTRRRWPGWRTSGAWSCTRIRCGPRTSTIPTSCASTSIPFPASSGRSCRRWPASVRGVLDELGLVGWPKTSGSRGIHVIVRLHRRWSFDQVRRCRAGPGPRGRAARAYPRHQQVVEGGAPRRVPRLQPEREGPHGVQRVLGPPAPRRPGLRAGDLGRAGRAAAGGVHAADHARAVRRDRRPARRRSTPIPARWSRCSSWWRGRRRRGSATRPGRRTTRSRPASRRACSRRKARKATARAAARLHQAADRDRALAAQGRRAGRDRALEGAAPRGGRAPAAGGRAGGLDARALVHVDPRAPQPRARAGGPAPAAEDPDPVRRPLDRAGRPSASSSTAAFRRPSTSSHQADIKPRKRRASSSRARSTSHIVSRPRRRPGRRPRPARTCRCLVTACRVTSEPAVSRVIDIGPAAQRRATRPKAGGIAEGAEDPRRAVHGGRGAQRAPATWRSMFRTWPAQPSSLLRHASARRAAGMASKPGLDHGEARALRARRAARRPRGSSARPSSRVRAPRRAGCQRQDSRRPAPRARSPAPGSRARSPGWVIGAADAGAGGERRPLRPAPRTRRRIPGPRSGPARRARAGRADHDLLLDAVGRLGHATSSLHVTGPTAR